MERVYRIDEKPFDDVRHAGIAIRAVDREQRHIGVLHREDASNAVLLLHLGWHHELRNVHANGRYLWVDPALPTRRLRQVAAVCRKVWRGNNAALPYAFSPPSDCFDEQSGRYLLGPTRRGLTCATFILAVFEAAGISLVKYEAWPKNRPGDSEWQKQIIGALRRTPSATPEHIKAVEEEIGSARYRPEEVAGAATTNPLPADFPLAAERGQQILKRFSD